MRVRQSASIIAGLALLGFGCAAEPDGSNMGSFAETAWNGQDDDDADEDDADDSSSNDSDDDDSAGSGEDPMPDDDADPSDGPPPSGSDTDGDPDPTDDGSSSGGEPEVDPPDSPYAGGWDIGECQQTISGTSVASDFTASDQFGDDVRLYDFCHKAVLVVVGSFT